jgi:hypothetical protein
VLDTMYPDDAPEILFITVDESGTITGLPEGWEKEHHKVFNVMIFYSKHTVKRAIGQGPSGDCCLATT